MSQQDEHLLSGEAELIEFVAGLDPATSQVAGGENGKQDLLRYGIVTHRLAGQPENLGISESEDQHVIAPLITIALIGAGGRGKPVLTGTLEL